jgi:hypothetical protein
MKEIIGRKAKTNGYGGRQRALDKARRRDEAEARVAKWQALSPEAKLKELDEQFGTGVGARRQRARLEKELNGSTSY